MSGYKREVVKWKLRMGLPLLSPLLPAELWSSNMSKHVINHLFSEITWDLTWKSLKYLIEEEYERKKKVVLFVQPDNIFFLTVCSSSYQRRFYWFPSLRALLFLGPIIYLFFRFFSIYHILVIYNRFCKNDLFILRFLIRFWRWSMQFSWLADGYS